jgi:hypothetical protein
VSELFGRKYSVTIGTRRITGLRCAFKVEKALVKDPNSAEIRIWNLSEDGRNALQPARNVGRRDKVVLTGGYVDTEALLFAGNVRFVDSVREGADWVTKITAGDGEQAYANAKFSASFRKGTAVGDVMRSAAAALGVDPGNLSEALSRPFRAGVVALRKGFTASGDAQQVMDAIARSAGLGFSIQDGKLCLLRDGDFIGAKAFLLGPDTGMVGSPQYGTPEAKDKTLGVPPRLKVKSLLQPLMGCGRPVAIDSKAYLGGVYRVEKCIHTGDTHGSDWTTEVELKLVPGSRVVVE